ncbi:hypothetical protein ACFLYE_04075 [Chloroflexota bacterium]
MANQNKVTTALIAGAIFVALISGTIFLASAKKGGTMEFTKDNTTPGTSTPPIDAAAPTETETATFALG